MATSGSEKQTGVSTYKSIEVEVVGKDEFVSKMFWKGEGVFRLRAAYGGQVFGQALMSACHTITDPEMLLISAHHYFMSPANTNLPVTYHVSRTKDGRVFNTRSIQAIQEGKVVSHCLASFKKPEVNSLELSHSPPEKIPPGVYSPDDPRQDEEKLIFNKKLEYSSYPFESYYCFRESDQEHVLANEPLEPRTMSWIRCHGDIPQSYTQNYHRVALAFLSDFSMAFPLRLKYPQFTDGFITSLDHTIWFHSHVQCDTTWFLQSVRCIQASEGTSLNASHMYSDDGTLVATCQQQALYRLKSNL